MSGCYSRATWMPRSTGAKRSFSADTVAPGGQVVVKIAVANYGGLGQIEDTLPEGFTYVSSEPAGATFDQSTRTVSFALVGDTSFSYTVTAPATAGGPHTFSGVVRDSAKDRSAVVGANIVTVEAEATTPPDPGDGSGDGSGLSPTPSATRSFSPASVAPGGRVVVTIAVANYGGLGQIERFIAGGIHLYKLRTRRSHLRPIDPDRVLRPSGRHKFFLHRHRPQHGGHPYLRRPSEGLGQSRPPNWRRFWRDG